MLVLSTLCVGDRDNKLTVQCTEKSVNRATCQEDADVAIIVMTHSDTPKVTVAKHYS